MAQGRDFEVEFFTVPFTVPLVSENYILKHNLERVYLVHYRLGWKKEKCVY